jgi:hypothetical protein
MARREDTCRKSCPFWIRYKDGCPHYVEGKWESYEGGEEYITKDCAPKRTMILTQQMYDHVIGTRRDYNQMRNAQVEVLKLAAKSVGVELIVEGEVVPTNLIEE